MNKTLLFIIGFILLIGTISLTIWIFVFNKPSVTMQDPSAIAQTKNEPVTPSQTMKEYADESGFKFNYPDNLSLEKNDTDTSAYADIKLSAKGVNGSLSLKIIDSKFKTLDEWQKNFAKGEVKETTLGNLKAREVKLSDRQILAAIDQSILFTIEIPLVQEDFWDKVSQVVRKDFVFISSASPTSSDSGSDVSFEGEENVE